MALYPRHRVPKRIPLALQGKAKWEAREWWVVMAPNANAARKLCLEWPARVEDGSSRIIDHGRNRT